MNFCSAYHSDIGIKKQTNQDALLLLHAETADRDEIVFAVICDGVGGLKMGELASAIVVRELHKWFYERMPILCTLPDPEQQIFTEWAQLIEDVDGAIRTFSEQKGFRLGTTAELLLLLRGRYYICHVGDCRVYSITDGMHQLTRDHSVVQQEIDAGRLTPEQARKDSRQNLLWQCVGAGSVPNPDFLYGEVEPGQEFLLCCDGFRRRVTEKELEKLCRVSGREEKLREALEKVTELCEKRGENDNITSILIRAAKPRNPLLSLFSSLREEDEPEPFCVTKEVLEEHAQKSDTAVQA